MCTYRLASKDAAKVQGRQKTDSGIAGIKGDMGWELECVEGVKKEKRKWKIEKMRVRKGIKSHGKRDGLPWLYGLMNND